MADDAQTTITLLTWTGTPPIATPVSFYATKDTAGNYSLQSTPRVMGAQIDAGNPMPVVDAAAETALTTIATNTAQGTSGTGIAEPAGGSGLLGWLSGIYKALTGTLTVGGSVSVSNLPATQPVSAATLPLPEGAATAANQPALNGDGGALVHVTNFPATQAVSGAVSITGNVSVTDTSGAAFQGAATITPGTATTAGRSVAYVCTAAGNITITLPDASTMTFGIAASPDLQTLPFAVTLLTLGTGTAGTFWTVR
jgi:hypothetical protein